MRKYLSTGLFGTILGLAVGTPADASLVSRGFLDEALENYATTTALDLKANQSDLTTLSDTIGTPAELTYSDIIVSWSNRDIGTFLFGNTYLNRFGNTPVPTNNISELINLNYTDRDFPGLAGFLDSLFHSRNQKEDLWPIRLSGIFSDYSQLYDDGGGMSFYSLLYSGGTMNSRNVLGLPKLTEEVNKIGTVPDEYATVGAALTAIKGIAEDAKAAALSAIPDPKAEGSTGKFVLTVDIVGDNATYRWEKIDRESETTTTTNE